MTRRRIIFTDNKGRMYATEEYNGDKQDFEYRGMYGYCDKDWKDIIKAFEYVSTVDDFVKADLIAQQYYHNPDYIFWSNGVQKIDFEYLPIKRIDNIEDISANEIYLVENGNVILLEIEE